MASREVIEARLTRKKGGTEAGKDALKKANSAFADWYGICRRCGEELSGTVKQIMGHRCGEEGS